MRNRHSISGTLRLVFARFKQTTGEQWCDAADAWHRWGPLLHSWPGPATEQMLDIARVLEALLTGAGLHDVEVVKVDAPVRLAQASECVAFERESFGALHQMLGSLDASERESVWDEISEALHQFEGPEGCVGPCELVLGRGTK